MRDLALILIVVTSLPVIIWRPAIGIFMWAWLGYMNPHRLAWGVAYDFPFAQLVAIATLVGFVFYKDRGRLPVSGITVSLIFFAFWMTLSTVFSIYPENAWLGWDKAIKIQLFTILTIVLMQEARYLKTLVWIIVVSLGFYGVKGGVFSLATGGNYLVWGPERSFIGDNNSLALALLMTVPLMRFCQLQLTQRYARLIMGGAIILTIISIFTTHSRGALVGASAMVLYSWWKARNNRIIGIVAIAILVVGVFQVMPERWFDRMSSIAEYDQDESAMGRINAWWFAFNLAVDKPFVGGGFEVFTPELFLRYAPQPEDYHDAHSVYFEVLAEQGFVGLMLFLSIGFLAFRLAGRLAKIDAGSSSQIWISQLAAMIRVSIVGYAVTGAFLGLAYFDLYYQLVGILVVMDLLAKKDTRQMSDPVSTGRDEGGGRKFAPHQPVPPQRQIGMMSGVTTAKRNN